MPKVGYSEKERVQIREALIAVGLDLMTKQGIQHTTVEQIYKKVGISRTFFYSFFPNKEELIVEALYPVSYTHLDVYKRQGQLYTAGNPFSRTGNALPYSGTEPFSHRHAGQNHWLCPAHCGSGSPSGPGHHGCPAYYHHCGCGEPDYIFSAGLQPAEDLGRMFRAGILFLYRIPAFCFWMVSGHLVPGYLVLCPILAPQFVNPQNPLLTMGNRFYYNKGKL